MSRYEYVVGLCHEMYPPGKDLEEALRQTWLAELEYVRYIAGNREEMKTKLLQALKAPGRSMAERLRAIGEDPQDYPPQLLEDLDWLSNVPDELVSYILRLSEDQHVH